MEGAGISVGVIMGYRRGAKTQNTKQLLIRVINSNVKANNLVGGKVIARDSYGNMYVGRVIRAHARGRNNVVIAVFKRSPPGQMIGSEVLIYR